MPYEVVARRWRPLTFDSVVGQSHVTATLANALERNRVAHAFLFTGIRGVGKTTVARLLARALNCSNRKGSEPCNECSSCTQILAGSSVDVLEIDGASNRGIDEVRTLIEAANYRPAASPYRIYIIDEVHQLTREAFNALLKILEEPPAHVKFVLATTEAHKVPPTVLSRCQRYDFRRLVGDEITTQLERIVKADSLKVSAEALALIAREADGSMRDAQSLLEQVAAATGGEAGAGEVAQLLGIASTELIVGSVEAILGGDARRIVEICAEVQNTGSDLEKFLFENLELLRHVTVANAAGPEALAESVGVAMREAATRLKDERSQLDLQRLFGALMSTAEELRRGGMPELVLEMGLLKAAALESVLSVTEILDRLDGGRAETEPAGTAAPRRAAAQTAGSSASRSRPPADSSSGTPRPPRRTSEPSRPSEPEAPPPSAATTATDVADALDASGEDAGGKWGAFLELIRREAGIDLYVTLSNCEVVTLEPELIALRPMVVGFRRKLEDAKTLARVRTLAAQHFGDKAEVRIVDGQQAAAGTGVSAHSIEEKRQATMEAEAMSDPVVKAAVEVLQGKVSKVSGLDK